MLKVFIDTEFTDFFNAHLISIGLVSESGEEFYAEVPYPDAACSPFVRQVVIPLLGNIPHAACAVHELPGLMLNWLNVVRQRDTPVEICFDYELDWDLFLQVFDYRVPRWCRPRDVAREINELLLYEYLSKNKLPAHHALYDARANRYAFRERVANN